MPEFLQNVEWFVLLGKILTIVIGVFITYASPKIVKWVAETANQKEAETHSKWIRAAIDLAETCVLSNYQKYIKGWKKALADGKLTKNEYEERMKALGVALVDTVKDFAKKAPKKAQDVLNGNAEEIAESAIRASKLKSMGVKTTVNPSVTTGNTSS